MGSFDKAFNAEIEGYNPPALGEVEELEMTVKEYHEWLRKKFR